MLRTSLIDILIVALRFCHLAVNQKIFRLFSLKGNYLSGQLTLKIVELKDRWLAKFRSYQPCDSIRESGCEVYFIIKSK